MIRNLLLIGSFGLVGVCWFVMPEGRIRNAGLLVTSALSFFLLLSKSSSKEMIPEELPETVIIPEEKLEPSRSLGECLRFHKMTEHPSAIHLLKRVGDYRQIVIKIANERGGKGTLWRGLEEGESDVRVRSCLCGTLTREELIKGLGIEERDPDPPKVGSGMGIEYAIRGIPIAEDGNPARRILYDSVADRHFNILLAHRPEAKRDLMLARERYIENVLRRLVGPFDGRGRPIVPLCVWKKRFDGEHYSDFEKLEAQFMG